MEKKQTTIGDLAIMIKRGFDEAQEDRGAIRQEMKEGLGSVRQEMKEGLGSVRQEMKEGFTRINARLDVLEGDIKGFVSRDEFEDVLSRLKLVEKTLGLKV